MHRNILGTVRDFLYADGGSEPMTPLSTRRNIKQHRWGIICDGTKVKPVVFNSPIYSVGEVRRIQSIALNLAAFVLDHCDAGAPLLSEIQELKEIVNGETNV